MFVCVSASALTSSLDALRFATRPLRAAVRPCGLLVAARLLISRKQRLCRRAAFAHLVELGVEAGEHLFLAGTAGVVFGQHLRLDRLVERAAGQHLFAITIRPAAAQEEHHQRLVMPPLGAQHLPAGDDHALLPLYRAGQRAVLQPGDAAIHRHVPRKPKLLRAGPLAKLVKRLQAGPDVERGLLDDAGGGKVGDEAALAIGRDGIPARSRVRHRRKIEQRIARLDRRGRGGDVGGGLRGCGAGAIGEVVGHARRWSNLPAA